MNQMDLIVIHLTYAHNIFFIKAGLFTDTNIFIGISHFDGIKLVLAMN